ncbi:hypothetical protein [Brevibacillus sp. AY1]|uniref:hypothetical protein n=1 Tax=Brevibacillus sp. AY1 TaxID=2807621 RepID=UPI002453E8C9|nr:hypothetical protein [Brevibacillus sp. AY1]MDH4620115.1 hypothetical protein [Brevibacillus sp. AY1]
MKLMLRIFLIVFAIVLTLIVGSWILHGYVALYVLDNPESVGGWIGKLISGNAGD